MFETLKMLFSHPKKEKETNSIQEEGNTIKAKKKKMHEASFLDGFDPKSPNNYQPVIEQKIPEGTIPHKYISKLDPPIKTGYGMYPFDPFKVSGYSGISGHQGYPGVIGYSGHSGISGYNRNGRRYELSEYSDYLAEHLDKNIRYTDYIEKNLDGTINDWSAGPADDFFVPNITKKLEPIKILTPEKMKELSQSITIMLDSHPIDISDLEFICDSE